VDGWCSVEELTRLGFARSPVVMANEAHNGMTRNQTTGYPDFETDPAWTAAFNANPFQIFTYQQRLKYAFSRPMQFKPGTNWSYAHTNFMILGHILGTGQLLSRSSYHAMTDRAAHGQVKGLRDPSVSLAG
jgi:hypothetical protein